MRLNGPKGMLCRRALGGAALAVAALFGGGLSDARADSVLVSSTSLVSASQSTVYQFQAPGPGTVSVQIVNLDWPQPLSSLSFMAATSSQILTSWSDPASQGSANLTFQVTSSGTYFADVIATAGGPLDLGLYSLCIKFTPPTPAVPLPASWGMLAAGLVALLAMQCLSRLARSTAEPAVS